MTLTPEFVKTQKTKKYFLILFSKSARVQLRYPDGRSRTKVFPADSVLQVVYDFANDEVAATFGRDNFSLSTTYPARQLDRVS